MVLSKMIEAAVAKVEAAAKSIYGNCPYIFVDNDGDDFYTVAVEYTADDKEIHWIVGEGLYDTDVLEVINNELLGIIKRIYAAAEEEENRLTLMDKFKEACEKCPMDRLFEDKEQTLYGNVMDWCRDYYGGPKDSALAYMLIGEWFSKKQSEQMRKVR